MVLVELLEALHQLQQQPPPPLPPPVAAPHHHIPVHPAAALPINRVK